MMGRQTDPTVLHSSIVLLQEIFKQLDRIKERELLRLFTKTSEHARIPSTRCDQSTLVHQDSRFHSTSPSVSLFLWPDIQRKHQEFHTAQKPLFPALRPVRAPTPATNNFNDTEVDTSLHL